MINNDAYSGVPVASPQGATNAPTTADALWLAQQKSAARLAAQQMLAGAADVSQPGSSATQQVGKGFQQYTSQQLQTANTAPRRMALSDALAEVADSTMLKAKALEQGQNDANTGAYFRQTLGNMSQLYGSLPYHAVDAQFGNDVGSLNSTLNHLPLSDARRGQMQSDMVQQLTDAANVAKLRQDPALYMTEQALARKPAERQADELLPESLRNNNPGNVETEAPFETPEDGLLAMAKDVLGKRGAAPPIRPAALATFMHNAIHRQYGAQLYAPDSILWAATKATQPDADVTPPLSSAPANSGLTVTLQGDEGANHVQNGSNAFTMGTAAQQQQWLQQAALALKGQQAEAAQVSQQQALAADRSRRQAASGLIDKFSTGNLNRDDILNSNLPPDAQTHAIAMMARGPATDGNDALHRQLFMQALNGSIQDKSDILPHLARQDGINPAQAHNVAAATQLAYEPYVKRFADKAQNFVMGQNSSIADPGGDGQMSKLLLDLQGQLADGQKKGFSPRDLLDPANKYYVGDRLIAAYARSPQEKMEVLNDAGRRQTPFLRQPDETGKDYVTRTLGIRRGADG